MSVTVTCHDTVKQLETVTETDKQLLTLFHVGTGTKKLSKTESDVTVFRNCNDPPCARAI